MINIEEKVLEILKNEEENESYRLMADIIRVLIISHGISWLSELYIDLIKYYNFIGKAEKFKPQLLKNTIKKLEEKEIIKIEERERGFANKYGTYKDLLIKIIDIKNVRNILMKDKKYVEYALYRHRKMMEAIGK